VFKNKLIFIIVSLAVVLTVFIWFVYWLGGDMNTLFSNFDGLNYLIVSKSWYNHDFIRSHFDNPLPLEYYPAHWPLYPTLISIFDIFMMGTWAMLAASLLGLIFFYFAFVKFLKKLNLSTDQVFWLCLTSLILPARWLAVRSIGSPEAWFMGFVLMSLLYYKDKKYFLAGIFGALAQLTKSPAILLFISFGIYELINNKTNMGKTIKNLAPVSLIPLAILAVFYFYYLRTGDFWAYFNSGDNFHLMIMPFSIFTAKAGAWVGSFWLEEVIFIWLLYGMGLLMLGKENKYLSVEFIFGVVFFATTLFVSHRDIARYILPIMPIALVGYKDIFEKKEFKWMLSLLAIPAILYAINFISGNTMNISDWSPYL
jgi:Gpi18-like mannosyltransferase